MRNTLLIHSWHPSNSTWGFSSLIWVLFSFLSAYSQTIYTIHLLDPWNSEENRTEIMVRGNGDIGWYPGGEMTPEENGWYIIKISHTIINPGEGLSFVSHSPPASDIAFLGSQGISDTDPWSPENMIWYSTISETCPSNEIWIIPKGENPPEFYCVNPLGRILFIFEPWIYGRPQVQINNRNYSSHPSSLCGWSHVGIHDSLESLEVTITNSLTGESYGPTGLGDGDPIDLTQDIALSDSLYVYPYPLPSFQGQLAGQPQTAPQFPEITGPCNYLLGITVRDFSENHPDFQPRTANIAPIPGIVLPELGLNGKPQINPEANVSGDGIHASDFDSWFNTHSNSGTDSLNNYQTCRTLPFTKSYDGNWEFNSDRLPSRSYFPIDDFLTLPDGSPNPNLDLYPADVDPRDDGDFTGGLLRDPTGLLHNFFFCSEIHSEFTYAAGQTLLVGGDDDIWVFLDQKLAIDLGGAHRASQKIISLDTMGLVPSTTHSLDIFHCERHTEKSSLIIKSNIYLKPPTDLNIGVSPEAVDQGLPNCNIPDSTLIPVSQIPRPKPEPNMTQKRFLQFLQKRGYPSYYSPEKGRFYGPSGAVLPHNPEKM